MFGAGVTSVSSLDNRKEFFGKVGDLAGGLIQNLTGVGSEQEQNFSAPAPSEAQEQKDDTQMYMLIGVVVLVIAVFIFKDKIF